ncbi:MAG: hypothetical protein IIW60_09095, partial [Alistipes sp.]|nr:hypothetical protein [Alistipes sp.]
VAVVEFALGYGHRLLEVFNDTFVSLFSRHIFILSLLSDVTPQNRLPILIGVSNLFFICHCEER